MASAGAQRSDALLEPTKIAPQTALKIINHVEGGNSRPKLRIISADHAATLIALLPAFFLGWRTMHLDMDAYLALGGFASVLAITLGLAIFVMVKRR